MKRFIIIIIIIIIISIVFLFSCSYDKNKRPGIFDPFRFVTWQGEVRITNDYYISSSDYLYIDKGTKIILDSPVPINIIIDGSVKMLSTKNAPIIFSNTSEVISSFIIEENSRSNIIHYCNFGLNKVILNNTCNIEQSKIKLLEIHGKGNSKIENNNIGLLKTYDQCNTTIQLNEFDRNYFAPPAPSFNSYKIIEFNGTGDFLISQNNLIGNSSLPTPATNLIIFDYSSGNLDFQNNYWMTNDLVYIKTTLLFTNSTGHNTLNPAVVPLLTVGCEW